MSAIRVQSAGGVVFRRNGDTMLFLLLGQRRRGIWSLPKGLIEEGEDELSAAKREVREESGLDPQFTHGKIGSINYKFGFRNKFYDKTVHFFLFETDSPEAHVGTEHDMCKWASFHDALVALTYAKEREIVAQAQKMIIRLKESGSGPDDGAQPQS